MVEPQDYIFLFLAQVKILILNGEEDTRREELIFLRVWMKSQRPKLNKTAEAVESSSAF